MGLFDRFRAKPSYLGITAREVGEAAALEPLVEQLIGRLRAQAPLISEMGEMVVARSPVLVLRDKQLCQPATILPRPMLARFWTDDGRETWEDPQLVAYVARCAHGVGQSDELARTALEDTENIYVSVEAPAAPWPDPDHRLRLISLALADVVRKFAAGLDSPSVAGSLGLAKTFDATSVRAQLEAMRREEAAWIERAISTSH